jgi:hypothetical protein
MTSFSRKTSLGRDTLKNGNRAQKILSHDAPPHLETRTTHQLVDDLHRQVERQRKLLGQTGQAVRVLHHRLAQEDPLNTGPPLNATSDAPPATPSPYMTFRYFMAPMVATSVTPTQEDPLHTGPPSNDTPPATPSPYTTFKYLSASIRPQAAPMAHIPLPVRSAQGAVPPTQPDAGLMPEHTTSNKQWPPQEVLREMKRVWDHLKDMERRDKERKEAHLGAAGPTPSTTFVMAPVPSGCLSPASYTPAASIRPQAMLMAPIPSQARPDLAAVPPLPP